MKKFTLRGILLSTIILLITLTACQGDTQAEFKPMAVSAADCNYGGNIKSVEATDQSTVKFTLCYPDPAFAVKIANPAFSITDDAVLNENAGVSKTMAANPIGTGPYRVKEYKKGAYLMLEPNLNYWGPPLQSKFLNITWSKDPNRRFNSLDSNNVNLVDLIPPANFAEIRASNDLTVQFRPSLNTFYLGFNNIIPPFDDENIRKAIGIGLNREAVVRNQLPEGSALADQLVPPTLFPGYSAGFTWYPQDVQTALNLINNTKYAGGFPVTLYYPNLNDPSLPDMELAAEAVKTQLALLGIDATLSGLDLNQFKSERDLGQLGIYLDYVPADYPDASALFDVNFAGENKALGRHYSDILLELNSAGKSSDPTERQGHFDRVNQMIKDHVPLVPMAYPATAVANNRSLENMVIGPLSENFPEMTVPKGLINFMQSSEPSSLWPADEDSKDTFRVASLIYDTLLTYDYGTTKLKPSLADTWSSNDELTEWTFQLRYAPIFTNGSQLDANDVVASFAAMWDASNPNHKGNSGQFAVFKRFFGNFINR